LVTLNRLLPRTKKQKPTFEINHSQEKATGNTKCVDYDKQPTRSNDHPKANARKREHQGLLGLANGLHP